MELKEIKEKEGTVNDKAEARGASGKVAVDPNAGNLVEVGLMVPLISKLIS